MDGSALEMQHETWSPMTDLLGLKAKFDCKDELWLPEGQVPQGGGNVLHDSEGLSVRYGYTVHDDL